MVFGKIFDDVKTLEQEKEGGSSQLDEWFKESEPFDLKDNSSDLLDEWFKEKEPFEPIEPMDFDREIVLPMPTTIPNLDGDVVVVWKDKDVQYPKFEENGNYKEQKLDPMDTKPSEPPKGELIVTGEFGRVEILEYQPILEEFEFTPELDDTENSEQNSNSSETEQPEIPTVYVETESQIPEPAEANTRYELPNGDYIVLDAQGRVIEKAFTPVLTDDDGSQRNSYKTGKVGKEGVDGDQGGHIQADILGGSSHRTNLFPQNGNFNQGVYKTKFENIIVGALKDGKDVGRVTVKLSYDDDKTTRPSKIEVFYTIDGISTVQKFENIAGGGLNDRATNS